MQWAKERGDCEAQADFLAHKRARIRCYSIVTGFERIALLCLVEIHQDVGRLKSVGIGLHPGLGYQVRPELLA